MSDARELLREILAGQREVRDELRALREAIESARAPARELRFQDAEAMAKIVPVLAGIFGDARFSCWEVLDRAGGEGVEGANLGLVLGGRDAHALGRLLARAVGADVGPVRIVRDGRDANGNVWRCIADPSS
jgi:hypothetical protein